MRVSFWMGVPVRSPLAEGRELKFVHADYLSDLFQSPLAEGRELKCERIAR